MIFNKLCTISTLSSGYDTYGTPSGSWSDTASGIPCAIRTLTGYEIMSLGTQYPGVMLKVYMKYRTLNRKDRITIDSITYNILRVEDAAGRGKLLQLLRSEV